MYENLYILSLFFFDEYIFSPIKSKSIKLNADLFMLVIILFAMDLLVPVISSKYPSCILFSLTFCTIKYSLKLFDINVGDTAFVLISSHFSIISGQYLTNSFFTKLIYVVIFSSSL